MGILIIWYEEYLICVTVYFNNTIFNLKTSKLKKPQCFKYCSKLASGCSPLLHLNMNKTIACNSLNYTIYVSVQCAFWACPFVWLDDCTDGKQTAVPCRTRNVGAAPGSFSIYNTGRKKNTGTAYRWHWAHTENFQNLKRKQTFMNLRFLNLNKYTIFKHFNTRL